MLEYKQVSKSSPNYLWFTLVAVEAVLVVVGLLALLATPEDNIFRGTSFLPAIALALVVLISTVVYTVVSILVAVIKPQKHADLKKYILRRLSLVAIVFVAVVGGGALFGYLLTVLT